MHALETDFSYFHFLFTFETFYDIIDLDESSLSATTLDPQSTHLKETETSTC